MKPAIKQQLLQTIVPNGRRETTSKRSFDVDSEWEHTCTVSLKKKKRWRYASSIREKLSHQGEENLICYTISWRYSLCNLNNVSHAPLLEMSKSVTEMLKPLCTRLKSWGGNLPSFACSWPFSSYNENTRQLYQIGSMNQSDAVE